MNSYIEFETDARDWCEEKAYLTENTGTPEATSPTIEDLLEEFTSYWEENNLVLKSKRCEKFLPSQLASSNAAKQPLSLNLSSQLPTDDFEMYGTCGSSTSSDSGKGESETCSTPEELSQCHSGEWCRAQMIHCKQSLNLATLVIWQYSTAYIHKFLSWISMYCWNIIVWKYFCHILCYSWINSNRLPNPNSLREKLKSRRLQQIMHKNKKTEVIIKSNCRQRRK